MWLALFAILLAALLAGGHKHRPLPIPESVRPGSEERHPCDEHEHDIIAEIETDLH